jgi:hypothetical protein
MSKRLPRKYGNNYIILSRPHKKNLKIKPEANFFFALPAFATIDMS